MPTYELNLHNFVCYVYHVAKVEVSQNFILICWILIMAVTKMQSSITLAVSVVCIVYSLKRKLYIDPAIIATTFADEQAALESIFINFQGLIF